MDRSTDPPNIRGLSKNSDARPGPKIALSRTHHVGDHQNESQKSRLHGITSTGFPKEQLSRTGVSKPLPLRNNLPKQEAVQGNIYVDYTISEDATKEQSSAKLLALKVWQRKEGPTSKSTAEGMGDMNMTNPQQPGQQMPQTPMQSSGPNQGQNLLQQPSPPQLQHQMQASPLPVTQSPSSMGAENPGIQPLAPQQHTQQQVAKGPQEFTPEEQQKLESMTRTLRQRLTPDEETRIRAQIARLPLERRQLLEARGIDPVLLHCRNRAQVMLISMKNGQQVGQGG